MQQTFVLMVSYCFNLDLCGIRDGFNILSHDER